MSARISEIYDRVAARILEEAGPLPSPCWVWQGSHSGAGRGGSYPRMSLDGSTVAVHRVMWTQVHGYIPPKKQIDHRCENRLCVNPAHLQMVTHRRNQRFKSEQRISTAEEPVFCQATYEHFGG
jgi:hypothetical protein